ncbi:MAG: hypothetical protein K8R21_12590 [Leptospira sp.]|nr:hypothetical protein [Leptospira sp.]
MNRIKEFLKNDKTVWIIIVIYSFYYMGSLQPKYLFTGDGLNKIIQSKSLIQNKFRSEEINYPLKDIDPGYKFYPFQGVYLLNLGDRHLGQYPLFFSVLISPVLMALPDITFSLLGVILFLFCLTGAQKFYGLHRFTLLMITFLTYLLPFSIDFSENIYTTCMTFFGLSLFLYGIRVKEKETSLFVFVFAGFLIAIGVWLRLEGIFFFLSLGFAMLIVYGIKPVLHLKAFYFFSFAFGFFVGLFFLFNYIDYGHIFGPRYLANIDEFGKSISGRFSQSISLLFAGRLKVGFFLYTPLFLATIIYFLKRESYQKMHNEEKVLLWLVVIFLPLIAFSAPNDGVVNWGPRYLAHAILPCSILTDRYLKSVNFFDSSGFTRKHIGIYLMITVSVIVSFLGFKFSGVAAKQLRNFQIEMVSSKPDIRIFQNAFLLNHLGMGYFGSKNLLVTDLNDLQEIVPRLKKTYKGNTLTFYDSPFSFIPKESKTQDTPLKFTGQNKLEYIVYFLNRILESLFSVDNPRDVLKFMTAAEKSTYLKFLKSNLKLIKETHLKYIEKYEFLVE